jgi:thioredoxin-related protein
MSRKSCIHCIYFKPNVHYPYLGLCVLKIEQGSTVETVEVCENFKEASLDELKQTLKSQGWLYCITCRKTITDEEELESHVKNHVVVSGVVIDEAISEEAPLGD